MIGALLADRPQQEPGEAAVAARPDDEQIGAAGFRDERGPWRALNDAALDLDIAGLTVDVASDVF